MRWSPIFVASVFSSLSWSVVAHPAPFTNSTVRSLHKRSIVCGIDLRTATADDCLDRHSVVNFKVVTTASRQTLTQEAVPQNAQEPPAGSSCDHVVELQVVAAAMQQSTLCGIVAALNSLQESEGVDVKRNSVLQPLANIANSVQNLFFLDSNVNGAKANYVQLAISGQPIETSRNQFFAAVHSYLESTTVASESREVAADLDSAISVILKNANTLVAGFPPPPPAGTRAQGVQILQNNLREALAAHAAQKAEQKITVVNLWNRVLLKTVRNE
ncbi:hypothetical protein SISNIDRAFT_482472 [Sistotremastrum niveocremeum HHB9708]|uniref:Uncharacterized protein n=1 Tax=Sistotremastrum niveocremeum HHB9708 TaxID=1314777 RepID=A0A164Y812_9AGAM|nr:hypothetical protein SISNIDRAFT_482472 [Sistotremastrum niveocremeum HHB9708]